MLNKSIKTISTHSAELSAIIDPIPTLSFDIVKELGGVQAFNVVAAALVNGAKLNMFDSFRSPSSVKRLFSRNRDEIMFLLAERAERLYKSPPTHVFELCSQKNIEHSEAVKCYGILLDDNLRAEADKVTLNRVDVVMHCIVLDVVNSIIGGYQENHYIAF